MLEEGLHLDLKHNVVDWAVFEAERDRQLRVNSYVVEREVHGAGHGELVVSRLSIDYREARTNKIFRRVQIRHGGNNECAGKEVLQRVRIDLARFNLQRKTLRLL